MNNNYKFTGHERDAESGFDYMKARHFASSLGRFPQPDSFVFSSLTNPQSLNLYAYVLNNPLVYVDPTGHRAWGSPMGPAPNDMLPGYAAINSPGNYYPTMGDVVFSSVNHPAPVGWYNSAGQLVRVTAQANVLGNTATITIQGNYTPQQFKDILTTVYEAIGAINTNAGKLSAYQFKVLRNITAINVSNRDQSEVDFSFSEQEGTFTLNSDRILLSAKDVLKWSSRFVASVMAHEALHLQQFKNAGGSIPASAGAHNQMAAFAFQERVGEALGGLSAREINRINQGRGEVVNYLLWQNPR